MTSQDAKSPQPDIISLTTVLSLLAVASLLSIAYTASRALLPSSSTNKVRIMFIWHLFDALTHLTLEASYLYNCFFTSLALPLPSSNPNTLPLTPPGVSFLQQDSRLFGAFYGNGVTAKLWQEYARADRRWGGADLTVISLELLTVFVMAPLALGVCVFLIRGSYAKAYFWMAIVATGELYGGFMTFAPEWLSGSPNLDTSNFMYLWVYLFFMNTLWVWFPIWILYEAYSAFTSASLPAIGALGQAGHARKMK